MTQQHESKEKPDEKTPWPKSEEELVSYIREMVEWPAGAKDSGEGYGRCVYAMSNASVATFRYIASNLGVTGFQASCADLDIIGQLRGMKNGFMVVNADDLLYPQYDIPAKVATWIEETRPRLADVARENLASQSTAHPDVVARWNELAALQPPAEPLNA